MKHRMKLFLLGMFLVGSCLAEEAPVLSVSQNAGGEVVASVSGLIARCGVTATNMPPTFKISETSITVVQNVAGVMCMRDVPPDAKKPYHVTLNFGRLKAGRYMISWSFPYLKSTYNVIYRSTSSSKP